MSELCGQNTETIKYYLRYALRCEQGFIKPIRKDS